MEINQHRRSCSECSRLWEEYELAIHEQLRLLERAAEGPGDLEEAQRLERAVDAAAESRESAWRRIRQHNEQVHKSILD